MRPRWMGAGLLCVALAGAGGWWFFGRGADESPTARTAQFTVRWRGTYQGTMTFPATLNWCPVTRIGVLEAMSGDSGIALVLYERDSLSSGPHTIVSPDLGATGVRPGAGFVMRWIRTTPDTALTGFRSVGGTARLQLAGGKVSGDVHAKLRGATGTDTLVVQGAFTGVPVVTTATGCT